MQKIADNEGITRREECQQIKQKLEELPETDRIQLSIPKNFKLDCDKVTQMILEERENV